MSIQFWKAMPQGFLKRGFRSFDKLDHSVKELIFDLGNKQNFECALCAQDRDLIIEHDHELGDRVPLTIFNIRGLVCQRCNQALKGCDMGERGYITSWENGYPYLSDGDYQEYKYRFDCRVERFTDAAHVRRVGCKNLEHRKRVLEILDRRYEERRFPWQQTPEEAWDGEIKSPEHAIQVLAACMQFVVDQIKGDPNYEPPKAFIKLMNLVGPIIEEAVDRRLNANDVRTSG